MAALINKQRHFSLHRTLLALLVVLLVSLNRLGATSIQTIVHASTATEALVITVTKGGIQHLTGATLLAAGLDPAVDPNRLWLHYAGHIIPLEVDDGGDQRLDPTDSLRFYAPPPGDRWNLTAHYWLTVEATAGPRFTSRNVAEGTAPSRTDARETGRIYTPQRYDSRRAGPDNDHWFSGDLRAEPGRPDTIVLPLGAALPPATGPLSLTVTGQSYTTGALHLYVALANQSAVITWTGIGLWEHQLMVGEVGTNHQIVLVSPAKNAPVLRANSPPLSWGRGRGWGASVAPDCGGFALELPGLGIVCEPGTESQTHQFNDLAQSDEMLQVSLSATEQPVGTLLDTITWERAARLELAEQGVLFEGIAGNWRYQLTGLPPNWNLYDLSEPDAPVRLHPAATSFVDGPEARAYLVTGPGTLHEPTVTAWHTTTINEPQSLDALYLAPEAWHATLEPLLAHRQAQGYRAAVASLEAIYDAWSYGAVDPEAIRRFLRHVTTTWPDPPATIILVGDGSVDPHDWTKRGSLNRNIIPPYLAYVDPWLGEAACDTCYGRLATDDPRDQQTPTLAIGRLPVKSEAELQALVGKLIAYDTAPVGDGWRQTVALIADDTDTAGDFAAESEAIAEALPEQLQVRRVYYDPSGTNGYASAVEARQHTLAAFNNGASLLVYTGHSHAWQWAITDPSAEYSWLLGLYDPDQLTNHDHLPVVLAMTCLSSAFATPAMSGTSVDERLVLARGGAIAVWGPAGFGVSYGHNQLHQGFFEALWATPANQANLGTLTLASLGNLASSSDLNSGPLFTYLLLGDPLTQVRLHNDEAPRHLLFLPLVNR
ncbi:C25 family cysteine peptidase [Candidatus Chloroploca sp. Khr17]|uniref:C25 family cysteine peptidase n=1 Tax=Candidatus Chloroploca sp. Khr17 TaxID=2496869 RepID=UPI00101CBE7E|nr:C25 family cysteine peptidase [Candidatus Chloroploca sp. Khr17]